MAMEAGSEQYVFPAMVTDVSPELPPLSVTFTHVRPEQSTPDTTMETTPKQPTIPVRSMEAILKPSAPTGTEYAFALEPPESARAPDQSLVLALGLESASSQFNPKSVSESASVPVQEFIPEDPVPAATEGSQASASVIQESVPESVPVAPEGSSEVPEGVPETVFEPVPALESSLAAPEGSQEPVSGSIFIAPEGSLSASRGSQELVPEPIPAAQEGISSGPNDCPESIFELGPEAPKGIPVIAPEPTPDSAPATEAVLVSFVTSLEANPESLVSHVKPTESNLISHAVPSKTVPVPAKEVLPESPELLIEATSESLASHVLPTKNILEFAHNAKFSRRPSPVKCVGRGATNYAPTLIPPAVCPGLQGFPKQVPPWSVLSHSPGTFSALPIPPPVFPDRLGLPWVPSHPPPQSVPFWPPTNPVPHLTPPRMYAWRRPLEGGGYCQDPALTVLSVLSLFNVSLFILCLSTWLCLCLCWPCAPLVLPPRFQSPRPLV